MPAIKREWDEPAMCESALEKSQDPAPVPLVVTHIVGSKEEEFDFGGREHSGSLNLDELMDTNRLQSSSSVEQLINGHNLEAGGQPNGHVGENQIDPMTASAGVMSDDELSSRETNFSCYNSPSPVFSAPSEVGLHPTPRMRPAAHTLYPLALYPAPHIPDVAGCSLCPVSRSQVQGMGSAHLLDGALSSLPPHHEFESPSTTPCGFPGSLNSPKIISK